ncbi:inositol phoshorylceramide synthase regulatory subunit [Trichophyton mentagrophytes]|uniref:DUF1753 domain-containing protein n=3 Tax=Trichophyton TaxID=5550 RepID=A0A059IZ03_TRIIM|nr:hypothetical protein TESG_04427 [Trichophyton tonsurans CBS 112818]EGE01316.1 hypothetical protein TEQG_00369 [Trichophyton equinum CBS 127.97]EZF35825.1 hypothetical protein H101_00650 [Trichophyton interdigitale H6]KDB20856.1 hypothetical protein H109_07205 [Trichophyton interdigitale MR816]GBF62919.1 inositol phoshorylceramide synthase regulatory subunit [Trichophyton mentagrophytes]
MGILSFRFLRAPRPQSFFYIMSLQTGATLIALSMLLNKLIGIYGLLSILTGFELSPVQLSMYIYSMLALGLTIFLTPYIRKQAPLQCLALAWFYLIDSVVNAAYTAGFAVTWFQMISGGGGPGGSTMKDSAGFTAGGPPHGNGRGIGRRYSVSFDTEDMPLATTGGKSGGSALEEGMLQPESLPSLAIICVLWVVRLYFVFVMMAFARQCLKLHAFYRRSEQRNGSTATATTSTTDYPETSPNPFMPDCPDGQGWKGKLGRAMVSVGKGYWLDRNEDDDWMFGVNRRFNSSYRMVPTESSGPVERERRRRSGTGPPIPAPGVLQAVVVPLTPSTQPHSLPQSPATANFRPGTVPPLKMYGQSQDEREF